MQKFPMCPAWNARGHVRLTKPEIRCCVMVAPFVYSLRILFRADCAEAYIFFVLFKNSRQKAKEGILIEKSS
jgi:hypothetical protein